MSDPKKDFSETEIADLRALRKQMKQRPTVAQRAVASLDITDRWPKTSWTMGTLGLVATLAFLDGQKMWIGVAVSVCCIPGLRRHIVSFLAGVRKAKGDS